MNNLRNIWRKGLSGAKNGKPLVSFRLPLDYQRDSSLRYEMCPASQTPCGLPPQRCVAAKRRREKEEIKKEGRKGRKRNEGCGVAFKSMCVM
jgi:hypothetical protein